MDDPNELLAAMLAVAPDADALRRLADYADHGEEVPSADDTDPS